MGAGDEIAVVDAGPLIHLAEIAALTVLKLRSSNCGERLASVDELTGAVTELREDRRLRSH